MIDWLVFLVADWLNEQVNPSERSEWVSQTHSVKEQGTTVYRDEQISMQECVFELMQLRTSGFEIEWEMDWITKWDLIGWSSYFSYGLQHSTFYVYNFVSVVFPGLSAG